jgi:hypothetical protein
MLHKYKEKLFGLVCVVEKVCDFVDKLGFLDSGRGDFGFIGIIANHPAILISNQKMVL